MKFFENQVCHGFRVSSVRYSKELNANIIEMNHEKTGARLCWLDNQAENKVFSISFRTIPEDNTGVFHILEHSVLCGSEKYPVKEPFVELLKSSMNTFLNAMTFPDMTMFPVSSRNNRDLLNLTEVYLDAVFRPRILQDECVFRQEGWRIEPDEYTGELVYKGVVFNEMKGALSDVGEVGETELSRQLFPDTGYGFNSGGDPESIPTLTYAKYISAYQRHYHPSNAWIYLDGDVPMDEMLALIASYLNTYEKTDNLPKPSFQSPVSSDRTIFYELGQEEDEKNKGHLYLSKIWDTWENKTRNMAVAILGDVLTGNNDAPLKKMILDRNLAQDFSLTIDDSTLQSVYTFHAENVTDGCEDELIRTLDEFAEYIEKKGLNASAVEASLNRFIYLLKEEEEPQGIARAVRVMNSWLYDGDPLFFLENETQIAELRSMAADSSLNRLAVSLIRDQTGRCILRLHPSKSLGEEKREEEARRLADIIAAWTPAQRAENDFLLSSLHSWQDTADTPEALSSLPVLKKGDANIPVEWPSTEEKDLNGVHLLFHQLPTGGIVNLRAYFSMGDLSLGQLQDASLICGLLGKLPTKHYDTLTLQQEIKQYTGRLGFSIISFRSGNDVSVCAPYLVAYTSVLPENVSKAENLLAEILTTTDFTASEKIMEIVFQLEMASRQRIVSAGHVIGIRSTLAHFSAEYALKEALEGSSSVRYLHTFVSEPDNMLTRLRGTAEKILTNTICRQRLVLSLTADQMIDLSAFPSFLPAGTAVPAYASYSIKAAYRQGFRIPARIGFAVRGLQMGNISSEFHGHWFLISNIITYSYLWNKVRVQGGAYGCGLQVDRYGNLYSYSYRDPSPHRTLSIDSGASAFLKDFFNGNESLDNYIISTLNDLNPLLSPREKGGVADSRWFTGYTRSEAEKIRMEILNATPEILIEAAKTLDTFSERGAICVVGPQELLDQCNDLIVSDL